MSVLEEQAWLAVIAAVEQPVQHPRHTEILLRIVERRAESLDGLQKQTSMYLGSSGNDAKKTGAHDGAKSCNK